MIQTRRIPSVLRQGVAVALLAVGLTCGIARESASAGPVDTRAVSATPKEVYGPSGAPIIIRLGNGGAGPTGVLRAVATDYLAARSIRGRIAWYQDISPNTLRQLRNGKIDIALVYEHAQEARAMQAGYASHDTLIFNDHFLIAGPTDNPAHLQRGMSPLAAFQAIRTTALAKHVGGFLSRDDHSATNEKERSIWRADGFTPWQTDAPWYHKDHVFPQPALLAANALGVYTLSDHGTWLAVKAHEHKSRIYVIGGDLLRNPCNALLQRAPSARALDFLAYLRSTRGQSVIARYGITRYDEPFFTNASKKDF